MEILPSHMIDPRLSHPEPGGEARQLAQGLKTALAHGQGLPELRRATQAFEAYFIGFLMKAMRETIPEGLIPNKKGEFFNDFYDQEIGRLAAQAGGLGLGAYLLEHLAVQKPDTALSEGLKSPSSPADTTLDVPQSPESQDSGMLEREE